MHREIRSAAWTVIAVLTLASVGALTGCGATKETAGTTPEDHPPTSTTERIEPETTAIESEKPLADTNWRLAEIQSMSDAVGTVRPDDPSLYTMRLNGDGTVNMRLNCNSASGTWSAVSNDNGQSGQFEFGPLAMTRALCPPPSLDEQIAAQSEFVRSFLLKDGRLYLSLMADGGIYAWEPNTE